MTALTRILHSQLTMDGYLFKNMVNPSLAASKLFCSFSTLNSLTLTRGDIVLLKGEQQEESLGDVVRFKGRPHIVVSSDQVAETTGRLLVAPLSTAVARSRFEVVLPANEKTGVKKASKVMANQINTIELEAILAKIGTGGAYLPQVNNSLAICFGDAEIREKLEVSRGDVVEIDFGEFSRSGVVVSSDYGNRASRIAMLAHSHVLKEQLTEFDMIVRTEAGKPSKDLLVQCHMINTLSQEYMDRTGRVMRGDMEKLTTLIYKTLGITK